MLRPSWMRTLVCRSVILPFWRSLNLQQPCRSRHTIHTQSTGGVAHAAPKPKHALKTTGHFRPTWLAPACSSPWQSCAPCCRLSASLGLQLPLRGRLLMRAEVAPLQALWQSLT